MAPVVSVPVVCYTPMEYQYQARNGFPASVPGTEESSVDKHLHMAPGSHGSPIGDDAALDPVCGMTVDRSGAVAKDLVAEHEGMTYYFCGRGCKLEFGDDPGRFLDPSYVPAM